MPRKRSITTARRSARNTSTQPVTPANTVLNNVLIYADISDFSIRPGDEQRTVLAKMWEFLQSDATLKHYKPLINGAGDAALIVFRSLGCQTALDFSQRWIEALLKPPYPMALRVAVHTGTFEIVAASKSLKLAIGRGPNTCARLAAIGDGEDIIVSEEFVDAWKGEAGHVLHLFQPSGAEPFEAFVKHGISQKIRVFRKGDDPKPSRRLSRLHFVQEYLRRQLLTDVEEDFAFLAQAFDPKLTTDRIKARICILAPRTKPPRLLESTHYRFLAGQNVEPGHTSYSLEGTKPEGPWARAFLTAAPAFINNLPSYEDNPDDYIQSLANQNVSPQKIRSFGRHGRAFIVLPFGIDQQHPDGVICIDTADPLKKLKPAHLEEIAANLLSIHGLTVGAMWRLRVAF